MLVFINMSLHRCFSFKMLVFFIMCINVCCVVSRHDNWFLGYWEISFVIKIWIEIPNESLCLGIEHDLSVVLRPLGQLQVLFT